MKKQLLFISNYLQKKYQKNLYIVFGCTVYSGIKLQKKFRAKTDKSLAKKMFVDEFFTI